MLLVVALLFLASVASGSSETISTPHSSGEDTCSGESCDKIGKLTELTNKLRGGVLSDMELDNELFKIMEGSPRPGNYYSIGFETGMEPGIVYGRQDVYKFASKIKIPLYMPGMRDYIISDKKYRKPVLLQLLGDDRHDDIASLPTGVMSTYRAGGTDNQYLLFHHEGSKMTCRNILRDKTIREFERS